MKALKKAVSIILAVVLIALFSVSLPRILECFLIHVAGWLSGMHTWMEFSAGMCIGDALGVNTGIRREETG